MQIFKAFFKVVNSKRVSILLYIVIFTVITAIYAVSSSNQNAGNFTDSQTKIAFFNEDDSILAEGLKTYLAPHATFVELKDERAALQDALYFRQVEYIIHVPIDFDQKVMSGESVSLDCMVLPDNSNSVYIDLLINEYLETARLYIAYLPHMSEVELIEQLSKDLSIETTVDKQGVEQKGAFKEYISYLAFAFINIFIVAIGSAMAVFNEKRLKMRNSCSPIKITSINLQLFLGCIGFMLVVWGILTSVGFIINGETIWSTKGLLIYLNTFALALSTMSIGFLCGINIKEIRMLTFISNTVSLGLCFISGVFVSTKLLGEQVLKIASFNPVYWFVKGNEEIMRTTNFTNNSSIFEAIAIQLAFAVIIVLLALVVSRKRRLDY